MPYQFAYQLQFKNVEDVVVTANIYDTLSPRGTTVFTPITGADDPLHIFVVDNDENKFSPIKALQAEIKFLSTAAINLNSFIGTSEDNRWYVEILLGSNIVFKGFLILDDMDEDFLDSNTSNVVTLIATDNIGLLKDEALTKFDGTNPRGYYRIITYLAWALGKTGLSLPINVVQNVREVNNPSQIIYSSLYLQAKTFEAEINESTNCYTVIKDIIGED